jgi:hypothetical protein
MKATILAARAAVLASAATLASSALAVVPNPYGAIAYSSSDGIYGVAANEVELEAAEQRAMANCAVMSGGQDCKIILSFGSGCAALVVSDDGDAVAGYGMTTPGELMQGMNKANAYARELCQGRGGDNCRLEQAFCSFSQP